MPTGKKEWAQTKFVQVVIMHEIYLMKILLGKINKILKKLLADSNFFLCTLVGWAGIH